MERSERRRLRRPIARDATVLPGAAVEGVVLGAADCCWCCCGLDVKSWSMAAVVVLLDCARWSRAGCGCDCSLTGTLAGPGCTRGQNEHFESAKSISIDRISTTGYFLRLVRVWKISSLCLWCDVLRVRRREWGTAARGVQAFARRMQSRCCLVERIKLRYSNSTTKSSFYSNPPVQSVMSRIKSQADGGLAGAD